MKKHRTIKRVKNPISKLPTPEEAAMKDYMDVTTVNRGGSSSKYFNEIASKRNTLADNLKYVREFVRGTKYGKLINPTKKSKKKMEPGDMYKAYQAKKKKMNLSGLKSAFGLVKRLPRAIGKAITGKDLREKFPKENYHDKAQTFIKSARAKGMTVKAEDSELIAYPKKKKTNKKKFLGFGKKNTSTSTPSGPKQFRNNLRSTKTMIDSI